MNSADTDIQESNLSFSNYAPELFEQQQNEIFQNRTNSPKYYPKSDITIDNSSNSALSENDSLSSLLTIFYTCKECKNYFKLKPINFSHLSAECDCKIIINLNSKDFVDKYTTGTIEVGCKSHKKNFIKRCKDCKKDLCEECLKEKLKENNASGLHTEHENHFLLDLSDISTFLKEIEESYNNITEKTEDLKRVYDMIGVLEEMNNKYPCYGIYKTLKKYMGLFKGFKSINNNNNNNNNNYPELIKIRTIKELEEIGDPNKIYKITIEEEKQKETLNNLDIFKNKSFANLVRLAMNNLKIKDISALSTCSFPKLKKLIIGHAELDNNCIDVIKNMTLPEIIFISLYHNKISSPEIFSIPENFETLKKFYVGFNLIDINLQLDENKKYYFSILKVPLLESNNKLILFYIFYIF